MKNNLVIGFQFLVVPIVKVFRMKENWLRVKTLLVFALLFSTGQLFSDTLVNLHDLVVPTEKLEDSHSELMELPLGLHRIEPPSATVNRLLIAIHDANTDGFEWTLPLQTMDDEATDTFFIRWDPSECPNPSDEEARQDLSSLLKSNESIKQVTIVGHGMGGVYLSQFARNWKSLIRLDGHVVAAPLKGTVGVFIENECGDILPKRLPPTIRFFQWRIDPLQHSLFKEMSEDPQVVDLDGSLVISLPEAMDDNPLDSAKALEIVASRIQAEYLEAIEHIEPVDTQP
ncbi:MAG: hypothetical protein F4077_07570 [Gammaproteobacteria bacterium]|nr:hypothetical protein [Gammaproteobacteria bacterium]MYI77603.1 hypothetical protein [Gammaproteobacteria bacterium]